MIQMGIHGFIVESKNCGDVLYSKFNTEFLLIRKSKLALLGSTSTSCIFFFNPSSLYMNKHISFSFLLL